MATPLQDILQVALSHDPVVLAAKAQELEAQSGVKMATAEHYPVVALNAEQDFMRKEYDEDAKRTFTPGLNGKMNLFAWGAIEAQRDKAKAEEQYYHQRVYATQEDLGFDIGQLYLSALSAKEAIDIYQESLAWHHKILGELSIIATHDIGRRSEMVEAEARKLSVETTLYQFRRSLNLALSQLAKYTNTRIHAGDLTDPFTHWQAQKLIAAYQALAMEHNPSYLAQEAELSSVRSALAAEKASRKPSINLMGAVDRDNKQIYVNLSWNVFDQVGRHSVDRSSHRLISAERRMEQVSRDLAEVKRTAQEDMLQSEAVSVVASRQIEAKREVLRAYELQFKIARRSLIDLLDAYSELSNIAMTKQTAQNNFRLAALTYLKSNAQLAQWATQSK
ncbi:MAG: TolC family protein [Neisseriaceae bacterium]|nr:TolC family protein [Neisseriaceae bacterium]